MATKLSLKAKSFSDFKQELRSFILNTNPELGSVFSDNSIGDILLGLNAGVGEQLSYYANNLYNEQFISTASQELSLHLLAENNNLKLPNLSPSTTVIDISVDVPVNGSSFDSNYLPILKTGTQFRADNGTIFELDSDVDFSTNFSNFGIPNRRIIPLYSSSNVVQKYRIEKREFVSAGESKQLSFAVISPIDFFKLSRILYSV